MTLARARILKAASGDAHADGTATSAPRPPTPTKDESPRARRVLSEVIEARATAARIVAEGEARAASLVDAAANAAASDAREEAVARLAASFVALRHEEATIRERELDRVVELAVLLAERLVGETLRLEPARIAELASAAIHETRGARRVRIEACPEDVTALVETLGKLLPSVEIQPEPGLGRGSLIVHTDIGRIDARLEPQLTRLAAALREALT